jgi:hypothetical protein
MPGMNLTVYSSRSVVTVKVARSDYKVHYSFFYTYKVYN